MPLYLHVDMTSQSAGTHDGQAPADPRNRLDSLRSGAVLALAVSSVVGIVGLVQWDLRLMLIGLIAGVAIIVTNAIIAAIRHWHARNTEPGAAYLPAEEVVRLRSPKSR